MNVRFDKETLDKTLSATRQQLLASLKSVGCWEGELSSSALSTATAVFALATVDRKVHDRLIVRGLDWLAENQNDDGGWGDTIRSGSNMSTTVLCWSALAVAEDAGSYRRVIEAAQAWLARTAGRLEPSRLAEAIINSYGEDRTFSVPILTMCVLAGRLGQVPGAWRHVTALPFELAACPGQWFKWLRLHVVSYALPALIAIGQVRFAQSPPRNPLLRALRHLARGRTLQVLTKIQPESGGFLEAIPLTSFVLMSLAAAGRADHVVVSKGVEFLIDSVREDGSWPIDTNLATWATTLSVNALAVDPSFCELLGEPKRVSIRDWLLDQQYLAEHPYTHARPGGWAWTDLPGGVPDADDTAGALLALRNLGLIDRRTRDAAEAGIRWLLDLQNRDGGIPTFCRGWGRLKFDRSAADITAHGLAAMQAWRDDLPIALKNRVRSASKRAVGFLARVQRQDGAWVPLWFGNEFVPDNVNPTYGTARVVCALNAVAACSFGQVDQMLAGALHWLRSAQNPDGGWGGGPSAPSSIEETALAVDALARCGPIDGTVSDGVDWLIERTQQGRSVEPVPIGFYFARLWYFEKLYPLIFTVSALEGVRSR